MRTQTVEIKAPNFKTAIFNIRGTAPLVIHRMSEKYRREQRIKIETGRPAGNKTNREPQKPEDIYNAARYRSKEGWDGFHAASVRNAMISACKLVGFPMTRAKLSIFVIEDGRDAVEPQIPLVRILAKPVMQEDIVRMADGTPNLTWRPAFHDWKAKIRIRWDADQFTLADVSNLLMRVGLQVGLCEGRPDSKNSAGMGWGLFEIEEKRGRLMKVESILRKIASDHEGLLTPEAVVEFARPANSPLHSRFEWDDSVAAHEYRLWQARQLIRVTVRMVDIGGEKTPVRVFVSLTPDRAEDEGGYREMFKVLANSDNRKQMLSDALEELAVFERKYVLLKELVEVFSASRKLRLQVFDDK